MAVLISDQLLDRSDRLLDAEPDERLVGLAQAGHEGAFAAIVRRYEAELIGQSRRLTSDGRGEDAVQQAFLNAFSALQAGAQVRHLRGWLHQILRNVVTKARMPAHASLQDTLVDGESLEETVQRRAQAHATLVELSALPDRQRDALVGTAVHGLPRAHVAEAMGLSEGAVRQLVHRARRRLRQAATALLPLPFAKLLGAARSGVDAPPDAALSAGAAASGGLAVKVGTVLASGVMATGLAVTHTFPTHHHGAVAGGARHHAGHAAPQRHVSQVPASGAAAAPAVSEIHGSSTPAHERGGGRPEGTRSVRSGRDRVRGRGDGHGPGDRGEEGTGRSASRHGSDGGSTSGRSGSGSGSATGSGPDGGGSSGGGSSGGGSGSSGSAQPSGQGSSGQGSGSDGGHKDGGHKDSGG